MNIEVSQRQPTSIRLTQYERNLLDELARERGVGRSTLARELMLLGLSIARYGHAVNVSRTALLVEAIFATCEVLLDREHADVKDEVLALANARYAEIHANA